MFSSPLGYSRFAGGALPTALDPVTNTRFTVGTLSTPVSLLGTLSTPVSLLGTP